MAYTQLICLGKVTPTAPCGDQAPRSAQGAATVFCCSAHFDAGRPPWNSYCAARAALASRRPSRYTHGRARAAPTRACTCAVGYCSVGYRLSPPPAGGQGACARARRSQNARLGGQRTKGLGGLSCLGAHAVPGPSGPGAARALALVPRSGGQAGAGGPGRNNTINERPWGGRACAPKVSASIQGHRRRSASRPIGKRAPCRARSAGWAGTRNGAGRSLRRQFRARSLRSPGGCCMCCLCVYRADGTGRMRGFRD